MAELNQLWHCAQCGILAEIVFPGQGTLFCCGEPMTLQTGNAGPASPARHLPHLFACDGKLCIRIGEEPHPMTEQHYIPWIEVQLRNVTCRKELHPGEKAEWATCFPYEKGIQVRCFCNLDGVFSRVTE